MKESISKLNAESVLKYYQSREVLNHYEEATRRVGLWKSEEIIFKSTFPNVQSSILELGCGVGRISYSLWKLGYEKIIATDFSEKILKRAIKLNKVRNTQICFEIQDATSLSFDDYSFDGVIFGFNGLMQIPGRTNRILAIKESFRVLNRGGHFVFTSHDRNFSKLKKFWIMERKKWKKGEQNPALIEFGDRFEQTSKGMLFIHVPEVEELKKDLKNAGFLLEKDILRSKITVESSLVREYSDECRFWICRKPE